MARRRSASTLIAFTAFVAAALASAPAPAHVAASPRDVILKLSGSLDRIVASENFKRGMNGLGLEPSRKTREEFDGLLASEARKNAKL